MLNIALIDFFIPIKYDLVVESLPLIGLLISIAWLASSFLDFAVGDLSDKIGVRNTLLLGIALSSAGALVFALSNNFAVMTVGIFMWGLSYVMYAVPSETFVLGYFAKAGSAYGCLYFFLDLAYAFAPLIALGLIYALGVNAGIVAAAVIALLSIPMLAGWHERHRDGMSKALKDVVCKDGIFRKEFKDIRNMNLRQLSLLFSMFVCGFWFMTTLIGAPLLFFHGQRNIAEGALLTFAFMVPFALMELVYGRIADSKIRRKKMINYGFISAAVFLFAFFAAENFFLLLALACLITFSANMAWSGSEVAISEHLPRNRKGEFAGIFTAGKDIGFDLAPLFYGLFAAIDLKLPFFVLGLMLFAAWLMQFAANRQRA
jgi:MFS family permease